MAAMGYRKFDEMIGEMQMLDKRQAIEHWKARGLDFTKLFHKPVAAPGEPTFNSTRQDHALDKVLDRKLIASAKDAINSGTPVTIETAIDNTDRTTGAMLSGAIARRHGHAGLADGTIHIKAKGTAGQSFGAWLPAGVTLELEGQANDYVGKGLSGGRIIVYAPAIGGFAPETRSSSATPRFMARSPGNAISAASPANGSRCVTPARLPSSKAPAITAANI